MKNDLVKDFGDSLEVVGRDALSDVFKDVTDVALSELIDGPIGNIPIVGTLMSLCKVGTAVYERHLLHQTLAFLQAFNSKTIKKEKFRKYKEKLNKNPTYAQDELGRVLLLLQRAVENEKAKIYGNLFRNYVNGEIDWEMFCDLSDITDRLFISDLYVLEHGYRNGGLMLFEYPNYHMDRLIGIGLMENHNRIGGNFTITLSGGNAAGEHPKTDDKDIVVNALGIRFCEFGMELTSV